MDVQLIAAPAHDLPSSQRVDAIVYDGPTDLRLWRPPGADRELLEHYGDQLPRVLEREREQHPSGQLKIGEMVRLHRGKLHCDFLLWVATRPPEDAGIRAPAPNAEVISRAVVDALAFCSTRHVSRVAIGALGWGPDELPTIDRLVIVARAANAYYDASYAQGRPAGIEEVLVCDPMPSRIREAQRKLGRDVKVATAGPSPSAASSTPARTARRRSSDGGGGTSTRKRTTRAKPAAPSATLTYDEVSRARASGDPYDRTRKYEPGDYMVHKKFGVGRVDSLTPEGFIMVLFENGETKRLLHDRS